MFGGGEVIGEMRFERGTGVDASPEERVSIEGYLDSKLSSPAVLLLVCRLVMVAVGEVVCGISRLAAPIRSTSGAVLEAGADEPNESPNPEVPDRPRPNREVGLNGFWVEPNESLNPEEVDP